MYVPYFPEWLEARSVRGVAMGVALAAVPAIGIVAPALVGAAADALHLRGSVLRVASLAAAIAFALVAASTRVGAGGVALLGAAIVLFAAARSPLTLVADVLALEALGDDRKRYGALRLFGSAGFLVGALFAGSVIDASAPVALPLAIGATYLLTFVAALSLPARAAPIPRLTWTALRAAVPNLTFLAAALLSQFAQSAYDVCFTLHVKALGVSEARTGVLWATGVAAEIALMWQSPRILARVDAGTLLVIGLAGGALRWLLLSVATGFGSVLALQPLHACSFACVWIGGVAIAARDTQHQATSQGLFSAALAIGATMGMVIWGALYEVQGGRGAYLAAGLVSAAACGVALAIPRRAAT